MDNRTYASRTEYMRQWRQKNKDKIKAAAKRDWRIHKEKRSVKHREWCLAHPGYQGVRSRRWVREHHLSEYGIARDFYERELKPRLSGPCDICGIMAPMQIDHDHATIKFRGLLCHHCNKMLGHAKDNFDTLIRAAEYLKR